MQRGEGRLRVNVQLIDAQSGAHIWAERFDKPVADLFDMQDEIVSRLANRLGQELAAAEARHTSRARAIPDQVAHRSLTHGLPNQTVSPSDRGGRRHMLRMIALMIGASALVASTALAEPGTVNVLDEYAHHPGTERLNTPSDEIEWLKRNELNHGELDDFPDAAIILHRVEVERYLKELGFGGYYKSFSYGFTDPVLVLVVRKPGMKPFAVARGLPGAGGITTEAAELHAMGTNTFVHVGTAGLLSPGIPWGQLVVSDGSYRDGAAFLLADGSDEQISRPDQSLTEKLVETVSEDNVNHIRALGFTMPIYYFQPGSMLRALLGVTGPDAPMFVEMEEASLFAVARLMGVRAASIVAASDRLENHDGRLSQEFWDGDLDQLERLAFQEAIRAIAGPMRH